MGQGGTGEQCLSASGTSSTARSSAGSVRSSMLDRTGVQGRMSLVPMSRPELDIAFSTHDELSPCPGLALGVSDCAVGEISRAVRRSRCGDDLPLGSPGALWPSRWIVHRSTGRRPE
ncbi:MAG: hypothetical protein V7646_5192 [Pseudonocardia sp.]